MTTELIEETRNWVCPIGVSQVAAECWAGGAGGKSGTSTVPGYGAGGGQYARTNVVPVLPGTYTYANVGLGGIGGTGGNYGTNGGDSSFGDSCVARGGRALGPGGSGGVGDVLFSGGNGAASNFLKSAGSGGGAGASSDGVGANGAAALNNPSTLGGAGGAAGSDGGAGGKGGDYTLNDVGAGQIPGGGGGGPCKGTGLAGARGQIRLTYTVVPPSLVYEDVVDAVPGTLYETADQIINGIPDSSLGGGPRATLVSVANGEFSRDGGASWGTGGEVFDGDAIRLRGTSSGDPGGTVTVTLTLTCIDNFGAVMPDTPAPVDWTITTINQANGVEVIYQQSRLLVNGPCSVRTW